MMTPTFSWAARRARRTNYTIGTDPGKTGAIAAVDGDGAVAWTWILKKRTHREIIDLLRAHADCPVMLERQFPVHGQGLTSTFTPAEGYGVLVGIVEALGLPLHLCRAQDWQRVMLAGEGKASGPDLKRLYVGVAERLWPSISFRGPRGGIDDGKAAACLIAEYGRRTLTR